MNEHDMTELAYKNGYEDGYEDGMKAAERPHGEWKWVVTGFYCSVCYTHEATERFLYCPNCGARMDGKKGGAE